MPHNHENIAGSFQGSEVAHSAQSATADLLVSSGCTEQREPGAGRMQSQSAVAASQVVYPSSREDLPGNYVDSFNLPAQPDSELCQQGANSATPEADADANIGAGIDDGTRGALTDLALTAATLPHNQENSSDCAHDSEFVYAAHNAMVEYDPQDNKMASSDFTEEREHRAANVHAAWATSASQVMYPSSGAKSAGSHEESPQPTAHPYSESWQHITESASAEVDADASIDGGTCGACKEVALTTRANMSSHNQQNSSGNARASEVSYSAQCELLEHGEQANQVVSSGGNKEGESISSPSKVAARHGIRSHTLGATEAWPFAPRPVPQRDEQATVASSDGTKEGDPVSSSSTIVARHGIRRYTLGPSARTPAVKGQPKPLLTSTKVSSLPKMPARLSSSKPTPVVTRPAVGATWRH